MRRLPVAYLDDLEADLRDLPSSRAKDIARRLLAEVRRARRIPTRAETVARLLARVTLEPNTGCWLWLGHVNAAGYGGFESRIVNETLAHRASYALLVGPIPQGLALLHSCDQPSCVNPAHLRPGPQAENMAEMVARGRQCNGERNPQAKMTAEQARALVREYASGESITVLETRHGLSRANVYRIIGGERWGAATEAERAALALVPKRDRPRGERHGRAKMTEERVREMRHLFDAGGESTWSLSRRFGVSPGAAWAIVKRVKWRHVA